MKISICSDIHLEFGPISLENTDNADVLILGGDICVAKDIMNKDDTGIFDRFDRSKTIHTFFQECCERFPHVVYIMGNHEHYNGDYPSTIGILRDRLGYLSNLNILDKQTVTIDDVTFIGGTLWTDMNKEDSLTMYHVARRMNDFQIVKNGNHMVTRTVPIYEKNPLWTHDGRNGGQYKLDDKGYYIKIAEERREEPGTLQPEHVVPEFRKMVEYIQTVIEGKFDQKFVVCTHHAPSRLSTHPRYQHDTLMNGAYSSSLDEYIMDHPQIKLWTHGHTHEDFSYMIGQTRVMCNPRGYIGYEGRASEFELKTVDI